MDSTGADQYLVYVRSRLHRAGPPELAEEPLTICSTYAEAREVQLANQGPDRECIIRFVGPAGGGD
jgi:hypothetical protein